MAYIPDEAIDDAGELSPAAFRLYLQLCKRRNKDTGNTWASNSALERLCDLKRSTLYKAISELIEKRWVDKYETQYICLKGSFHYTSNPKVGQSLFLDKTSTNRDRPSTKIDSHIRNNHRFKPPDLTTTREAACPTCDGDGWVWNAVDKMSRPCYECASQPELPDVG